MAFGDCFGYLCDFVNIGGKNSWPWHAKMFDRLSSGNDKIVERQHMLPPHESTADMFISAKVFEDALEPTTSEAQIGSTYVLAV